MALSFVFFFFTDTATTEIYTLSLHDALPILVVGRIRGADLAAARMEWRRGVEVVLLGLSAGVLLLLTGPVLDRSEEHTSELQSRRDLVCRLLLEKKKKRY